MKKLVIMLTLIIAFCGNTQRTIAASQSVTGADFNLSGYAAVNGTVTGGTGGTVVDVSKLADLQKYASKSGKYIIKITGTITGNGDDYVDITSDKTIVGEGTAGVLDGVMLSLARGVSNVAIRNITIHNIIAPHDNIHIEKNCSHIWIDHCDLYNDITHHKDYHDGLLDISHGCDYITVSWNVFHDHWKTSLVGHSDANDTQDHGKLHVTYHHNYFYNVDSRCPSIRFGTLHAYNNYYKDFFFAATAVSVREGAVALVENCYFQNVKGEPILTNQSKQPGYVQLNNNQFENSGIPQTSPTTTLTIPYNYSLNDVASVPTLVTTNSGVGKLVDPTKW